MGNLYRVKRQISSMIMKNLQADSHLCSSTGLPLLFIIKPPLAFQVSDKDQGLLIINCQGKGEPMARAFNWPQS